MRFFVPTSSGPAEIPFHQVKRESPVDRLGNTLPLREFMQHHFGRVEGPDAWDVDELGLPAVNPFLP